MEYLEPTAEEMQMAGNSKRLKNAFIQVGFTDSEAFEMTKVWYDRTVQAACARTDTP